MCATHSFAAVTVVTALIRSQHSSGSIVINGKAVELSHIRNSLIEQCKGYKFQILARTSKIPNTMDEKYDEIKETNDYNTYKGSMFASINAIRSMMTIENTDLKTKLVQLETQLTTKESKKHITRTCAISGCKRKAPKKYPNNIYLCDYHKIKCTENLKCEIPCKKGSQQDKKLCRELKIQFQELRTSIATPDKHQSFCNIHLYPQDYFSVAMAKLLYIHQQISQSKIQSPSNEQNDAMEELQQLVVKLMDLLIISRQNLNCQWCPIFRFILQLIAILGIIPSHIAAGFTCPQNALSAIWVDITTFIQMVANFIHAMYNVVTTLLTWIERIIRDVISAVPFVGGAAAVGAGIGVLLGGPLGALAGGLIGGGLAAMFKYG
eukprot:260679_1